MDQSNFDIGDVIGRSTAYPPMEVLRSIEADATVKVAMLWSAANPDLINTNPDFKAYQTEALVMRAMTAHALSRPAATAAIMAYEAGVLQTVELLRAQAEAAPQFDKAAKSMIDYMCCSSDSTISPRQMREAAYVN